MKDAIVQDYKDVRCLFVVEKNKSFVIIRTKHLQQNDCALTFSLHGCSVYISYFSDRRILFDSLHLFYM